MLTSHQKPRSETQIYFYKLTVVAFISGLPNLWKTDLKLPRLFKTNFFLIFTKCMTVCFCILVFSEFSALFTHQNLTEKQQFDRLMFSVTHPLLYSFWAIVARKKDKVKQVIFYLTVSLKKTYNHREVEHQMLKKAKLFSIASVFSYSIFIVSYSTAALIKVVRSDKSFTTVVTAWPDVDNISIIANVGRAFFYITWCILMCRICTAYMVVISTTICLSYQYKNLQNYFYSLEETFSDQSLSQVEKEEKYEKALKLGIQMHSETLVCTQVAEDAFNPVFSGQIPLTIIALIMLMMQMTVSLIRKSMGTERTLQNLLSTVCVMVAVLSACGIYMCIAGDITVEAALLPTAMYSSGWQNCQGACNVRVRRLLLFAMTIGQQPVVLKAFDCVELSYQSFVFIVKSAYSVFSVIY